MNDGFVQVSVSEAVQNSIRKTFDAGAVFFGETLLDKMLNRLPLDTGYRPYGVEYSYSQAHPDEVESFSIARRVHDGENKLTSASAKILYCQLISLFSLLEPIVEEFTIRVAADLTGSHPGNNLFGSLHGWSLLQLNHSRPCLTENEFINDCHEDGCLITAMAVTETGLEVQTSNGSFLPITPSRKRLLLMSGEILWLLSGGKVRPTHHRVRAIPSITERMSILFFADINPALCDAWVHSEVNSGIDIGRRVMENSARYGLTEWKVDEQ